MDPRLVLYTVSISHNKSVLFVNREVVRVIRELTWSEGVSVQEKSVELVEIKDLKISCPDIYLTNHSHTPYHLCLLLSPLTLPH